MKIVQKTVQNNYSPEMPFSNKLREANVIYVYTIFKKITTSLIHHEAHITTSKTHHKPINQWYWAYHVIRISHYFLNF